METDLKSFFIKMVNRPRPYLSWAAGLIFIGGLFGWYVTAPTVSVAVLSSTIRQSTPLLLGALGGIWAERSGVVNIGIEGQMLLAAFCGFLVYAVTSSALLAVTAAMLVGAFGGLLLAAMAVTLRMDQIVAGAVINMVAFGLTGYFFHSGLTGAGKLQTLPLGFLKGMPFLGPVLGNLPPITCTSLLLVLGVHLTLFHTPWGLRTRAAGEHPRAAASAGIDVYKLIFINLAVGGALAGLAGAFLSLEAVGSFERAMTNGRGFVALAVMIFGRWRPIGAWGAALLFGFASAIQTQLQFANALAIPHQFVGMLPYLLTILVLALFVGRARAPAAIGQTYIRE